ncbi:MAG: hypothetical protein Q9221_006607 [Calogaya cf. arnoldii]
MAPGMCMESAFGFGGTHSSILDVIYFLNHLDVVDTKTVDVKDAVCAICQGCDSDPEADRAWHQFVRLPSCGHLFGRSCLFAWLKPFDNEGPRIEVERDNYVIYIDDLQADDDDDDVNGDNEDDQMSEEETAENETVREGSGDDSDEDSDRNSGADSGDERNNDGADEAMEDADAEIDDENADTQHNEDVVMDPSHSAFWSFPNLSTDSDDGDRPEMDIENADTRDNHVDNSEAEADSENEAMEAEVDSEGDNTQDDPEEEFEEEADSSDEDEVMDDVSTVSDNDRSEWLPREAAYIDMSTSGTPFLIRASNLSDPESYSLAYRRNHTNTGLETLKPGNYTCPCCRGAVFPEPAYADSLFFLATRLRVWETAYAFLGIQRNPKEDYVRDQCHEFLHTYLQQRVDLGEQLFNGNSEKVYQALKDARRSLLQTKNSPSDHTIRRSQEDRKKLHAFGMAIRYRLKDSKVWYSNQTFKVWYGREDPRSRYAIQVEHLQEWTGNIEEAVQPRLPRSS